MGAIIAARDPAAADSPLRAEATAAPAAPAEPVEEKPVEDKPAEEPPAADAPQDPPVTLEKSQEDEPPKEKPLSWRSCLTRAFWVAWSRPR